MDDLPDPRIELKRRTPDEQLAYLEDQCLSFISANSELRARLAQAEAERGRLGNHWRYNRGELSGYTVGEVEYVESKLRAAEAALARVTKLCDAADRKGYAPTNVSVAELRAALVVADTGEGLSKTSAKPLVVADTPKVEIGGQPMTQAQFDAARYPLLNPAEPTSPSEVMTQHFRDDTSAAECDPCERGQHWLDYHGACRCCGFGVADTPTATAHQEGKADS